MPYALRRPRLYYERRGQGEPLLLITGFAISAAVFEPVLDLYGRQFDCITYDNRGSGRSGAPWWPTSIPELAADAARLLDALEVPSAHVLGLSMGGMIAQELAIRFPERVRGLILGGTTPGGPMAARPAVRELGAVLLDAAGAARHDRGGWLAALLFSPEFRRSHPSDVAELLKHFHRHRASPQGATAHLWASVYHDTVSRLNQIQAPTLVLHGQHDVMSPRRNSVLLRDGIPDAELVVLPAGHAFPLEVPQASLDAVLDWLRRRPPIEPGNPRTGWGARAEPVTRALGLQIGALRTGGSLVRLARHTVTRRSGDGVLQAGDGGGDVAVDRRAA